jgi:hypothetical protein
VSLITEWWKMRREKKRAWKRLFAEGLMFLDPNEVGKAAKSLVRSMNENEYSENGVIYGVVRDGNTPGHARTVILISENIDFNEKVLSLAQKEMHLAQIGLMPLTYSWYMSQQTSEALRRLRGG